MIRKINTQPAVSAANNSKTENPETRRPEIQGGGTG